MSEKKYFDVHYTIEGWCSRSIAVQEENVKNFYEHPVMKDFLRDCESGLRSGKSNINLTIKLTSSPKANTQYAD